METLVTYSYFPHAASSRAGLSAPITDHRLRLWGRWIASYRKRSRHHSDRGGVAAEGGSDESRGLVLPPGPLTRVDIRTEPDLKCRRRLEGFHGDGIDASHSAITTTTLSGRTR